MQIQALVESKGGAFHVTVNTDGRAQELGVPPKANGQGSGVNGGELLFLALATCYCNDIYREAAREGIEVTGVTVRVEGEFGGVGEPARNVTYHAKVTARGANEAQVLALMAHTDRVAEIQNTLRQGVAVRLGEREVGVE